MVRAAWINGLRHQNERSSGGWALNILARLEGSNPPAGAAARWASKMAAGIIDAVSIDGRDPAEADPASLAHGRGICSLAWPGSPPPRPWLGGPVGHRHPGPAGGKHVGGLADILTGRAAGLPGKVRWSLTWDQGTIATRGRMC